MIGPYNFETNFFLKFLLRIVSDGEIKLQLIFSLKES